MSPVSDGHVCRGCDQVVDDGYVIVAGATQGLLKFAGVPREVTSAVLSLSYSAYPVYEHDVRIYGFESATAEIAASEQDVGSLLGTLHISAVYGASDPFLDVTSFVSGTSARYLGFRLEAGDEFSVTWLGSLEYGGAAQLFLMPVPEPSEAALMFAGLLSLAAWLRRRTSN